MKRIVSGLSYISIILIGIFLISGCTEKVVHYPVEIPIYKSIPKTLLVDDIDLPKPMDRKTYIEANPIEREVMLTTYINKLFKPLGEYKVKLSKIRKLNENNEKVVKKEAEKIKKKYKFK